MIFLIFVLAGLGGTFVMKSGRARHHIMPYNWNNNLTNARRIHNWLHYCDLDAPLVAVGTLLSSNLVYKDACEFSDLKIMLKCIKIKSNNIIISIYKLCF